jgi:hypothetical protein
MVFKEYWRNRPFWRNAFQSMDPPKNIKHQDQDVLLEEEDLKLFQPGVLIQWNWQSARERFASFDKCCRRRSRNSGKKTGNIFILAYNTVSLQGLPR